MAKGVLVVGLLPRLEARIESALLVIDQERGDRHGGIGDSLFGVKYRPLDETDTFPAALLGLTLRLPTGDEARGLGEAGFDVGVLGVVSKTFGPITLTANGGYTFVIDDRDLDLWTLASSVEYRLSQTSTLVGEIVAKLGATRAPDTVVARAGVVYAITDRIRFDAAIGVGLTSASPDVIITLGATFLLY